MNSTTANIGLEKKIKNYYDKNTPIFIEAGDALQLAFLNKLIGYRFLVLKTYNI